MALLPKKLLQSEPFLKNDIQRGQCLPNTRRTFLAKNGIDVWNADVVPHRHQEAALPLVRNIAEMSQTRLELEEELD